MGRSTGMLLSVGSSSRLSCVLAPSTATPRGTPAPSVKTERFTPDFARSVGFGPVFFPAQRRFGQRPVDALEVPLNALQIVVLQERHVPQLAKHAALGPLLKIMMQAAARTECPRRGLPLATCPEHIEDAVRHVSHRKTR